MLYYQPTIPRLLGKPEGLRLSRPSNSQIQIAAGRALVLNSGGLVQLATLSTALAKNINAAWAQGNNAGGLATSLTLASETLYHVFLLLNASGAVDAYFDTSATANNKPSGWDARMIGSITTTTAPVIRNFDQTDDRFDFLSPVAALSTTNLSLSNSNVVTLLSPSFASAYGTMRVYHASAEAVIFMSSEALSPNASTYIAGIPTRSVYGYWQLNGNRMRIYVGSGDANTTVDVIVRGFVHPRGA